MRISALAACLALTTLAAPLAHAQASRQARDKKTVLLYADPIAFSPYAGYGGNVGLLLTADLVLEAGYTVGSSCMSDDCQFETLLSEARLKWFAGNSFYLNLGAGREEAHWDHGIAWGHSDEANADFKAKVTTTGAVVALGNMWQHGAFTIGCDWFGLYLPMTTSEFEFTEGDGYNQASREDDEDDAKKRAMGTHFLALRLHLGIAL